MFKFKEVEYYKMFVVDKVEPVATSELLDTLEYGFVLTGKLSAKQLLDLSKDTMASGLTNTELTKTLFTRKEWKDSDIIDRLIKQIKHYFSFGTYGQQTIEVDDKQISFNIIKVVTKEELKKEIEKDIYENKPLQTDKVLAIADMIKRFDFSINFSKVKNREFKAIMIAEKESKLLNVSGDDAVRAIVYLATGNTLLINSRLVREALSIISADSVEQKAINKILSLYKEELASSFNRHKDLILSVKHSANRTIINKIAKLSKKLHKPVVQSKVKVFIDGFKKGKFTEDDLKNISVVDKFRLMNVLATRRMKSENRTFMIRNGKMWTTENKETDTSYIKPLQKAICKALKEDLKHLKGKTIKYPKYIDYALPISEKMSAGNVPFGTLVFRKDSNKLMTAGMYWRNEWGARDLDLSSVALDGSRVGWGFTGTYGDDVIFSGDITNAPNGAIECLANNTDKPVILINNLFSGESNCGAKFKIVIGEHETKEDIQDEDLYLEDTLFNFDYKFQGDKRSCVLGALFKDTFIVYPANLGSLRVSGGRDNAMLKHIVAPRLTMKTLLRGVGAILVEDGECDIDLSLEKITFQDLVKVCKGE